MRKAKPDNADVHLQLGIAHRGAKRIDLAIAAYQQAIAIDPSMVAAYQNLGNLHFDQKDYARAVPLYEQELRLDPTHRPRFEAAADHVPSIRAMLQKSGPHNTQPNSPPQKHGRREL